MDLRVEYFYDDEAKHWSFRVPSLRIIGGGQATRHEAEEAAREAILFTLDDHTRDAPPDEATQVGYFHVGLEKAS